MSVILSAKVVIFFYTAKKYLLSFIKIASIFMDYDKTRMFK